MWNLSDRSSELCERIVATQFHKDMFVYLGSKTLSPDQLAENDDIKRTVIQGQLGTLHNVVQKVSNAQEAFRECKAVDVLQPFRQDDKHQVSND